MITKNKLQNNKLTLEKHREERETSLEKLLVCAFLLNCSSSEREIMNEECGIYRKSFHLKLSQKPGFSDKKVGKSSFCLH